MQITQLFADRYVVAATMDGCDCPAQEFLVEGEAKQQASRLGLTQLLERVAANGLSDLSSKLTHAVDGRDGIYEFIKGDLRLFYFKGRGNVIVVCTAGVVKKGQKADRKAVAAAVALKKRYQEAHDKGNLEWVETE